MNLNDDDSDDEVIEFEEIVNGKTGEELSIIFRLGSLEIKRSGVKKIKENKCKPQGIKSDKLLSFLI